MIKVIVMGRITRSSKTEQIFCLETVVDPVQRLRRSKTKPSEGDADSNLVTNKTTDFEALNNVSSCIR